jgi:hypothetical protein
MTSRVVHETTERIQIRLLKNQAKFGTDPTQNHRSWTGMKTPWASKALYGLPYFRSLVMSCSRGSWLNLLCCDAQSDEGALS